MSLIDDYNYNQFDIDFNVEKNIEYNIEKDLEYIDFLINDIDNTYIVNPKKKNENETNLYWFYFLFFIIFEQMKNNININNINNNNKMVLYNKYGYDTGYNLYSLYVLIIEYNIKFILQYFLVHSYPM